MEAWFDGSSRGNHVQSGEGLMVCDVGGAVSDGGGGGDEGLGGLTVIGVGCNRVGDQLGCYGEGAFGGDGNTWVSHDSGSVRFDEEVREQLQWHGRCD